MRDPLMEDLLDDVYRHVGSFKPAWIAATYGFNVINQDLGDQTLGVTVRSCRCTTIVLSNQLTAEQKEIVPLHEIKHALYDPGDSTPLMRQSYGRGFIPRIEADAQYFALHALMRSWEENLVGLTNYQILQFLGLNENWIAYM